MKASVPKLKICGITNLDDLLHCIRLRIDYIGFNIHPKSPRFLKPEAVAEVWAKACSKISHLETVPVIVSVRSQESELLKLAEAMKTDLVFQLHGEEDSGYIESLCRSLNGRHEIWKALAVKSDQLPDIRYSQAVKLWLFDSQTAEGVFGGAGQAFDWGVLKEPPECWGIAGGIGVRNIDAAIRLKPDLIDICSGCEKEPGLKDQEIISGLWERFRV